MKDCHGQDDNGENERTAGSLFLNRDCALICEIFYLLRRQPDLNDCPNGIFRLYLSHTPDNIGWARKHRIDLVLAGHVHGGQIRLPVLGSVFVPSRHSRKYDCGTFYEPPTVMHVGRGLAGQHPLRFFCKPEVTRIILRSSRVLEG